jgi:hypothetical protein
MEKYLLRFKERLAESAESIQQTKQLIELSELWLSGYYAAKQATSIVSSSNARSEVASDQKRQAKT